MGGPLGVVLAAGAGRRMGMPKALLRTPGGESWAARAATTLLDGGCPQVLVVVGAAAAEVAAGLPAGVATVTATRWAEGIGASLTAGLLAAGSHPGGPRVAVIHLVDLPGVPPEAVRRTLEAAGAGDRALARAVYGGRPGHPVVIGRSHWRAVLAHVAGERGAGEYLREHRCREVECGDLADGGDVDTPGALAAVLPG